MSKGANLMRLALLQLKGTFDKQKTVENALKQISKTVKAFCPRLVCLPECFNSPYGTQFFDEYAETIPDGYTCKMLSSCAKDNCVYVIGGTIPERDGMELYNTCTVWNPNGEMIAKHRKVHLFDIDVKGGIRFKESETLTAGNDLTVIEIDDHKIGIGICYDIRFEEMAKLYRKKGCEMLIYPAAFNLTTGPLHWELLQRARANDNQLFVASISPARDGSANYVAWGHSMLVDPWGKVLQSAKEDEEVVIGDIDFGVVEMVRQQIPVFQQRRTDVYETNEVQRNK